MRVEELDGADEVTIVSGADITIGGTDGVKRHLLSIDGL